MKGICKVCCNEKPNIEKHHLDYGNNIIIKVCHVCHQQIHHTNDLPQFKAVDGNDYLKIIKVEEKTHKRLMELGIKGETFDQIINKLIDKVKNGKRN